MSSRLTYRGRLAVDGDPLDLVIDMRIENGTLEVRTSRESLGSWPIAEVFVSRIEDGRFALRLGNEEAIFRADDPLSFSFEAVSAIQAVKPRLRRLRASKSGSDDPRRTISVGGEKQASSDNDVSASQPVSAPTRRGRHLRSAEQGA